MFRERLASIGPRGFEPSQGSVRFRTLDHPPGWSAPDTPATTPLRGNAGAGAAVSRHDTNRFHAIDALRAYALLLGVFLHSILAYLFPPAMWTVGTTTPAPGVAWLGYYIHAFRLETFFLLAGFLSSLAIRRRGVAVFLKDRATRIVLVFVVLLYPMRILVDALWLMGGAITGARPVPAAWATEPLWWRVFLGWQAEEWPHIAIGHLWFLYYLMWITGLFITVRSLTIRLPHAAAVMRRIDAAFSAMMSSRFSALVIAVGTTPLLVRMSSIGGVDTPDRSLMLHRPLLVFYTLFFCLGWWLHRNIGVLEFLRRRWTVLLPLSVAVSAVTYLAIAAHLSETGLFFRIQRSFGTSLTTSLAVLGWLGLFLDMCGRPSPRARYIADASYFLYLAHLPLVLGLQILVHQWTITPWMKIAVINTVALPVLLGVYHLGVRHSWVGTWLNGRRIVHAKRQRDGVPSGQLRLPLHSA